MNTFKKNTPLVVTWKILGLSEMPVSLVGKTIKFKYKTSRGENDGTSDCTLKDDSVEWTLPVSKQKFCGVYSLELSVYHADGTTLGRFTYDNAFLLSDAVASKTSGTETQAESEAGAGSQALTLYSYSSASLYELAAAEADRQAAFNTNEAARQSNESVRKTNESIREANETNRKKAETSRCAAENERQENDAARQVTLDKHSSQLANLTSKVNNVAVRTDDNSTAISGLNKKVNSIRPVNNYGTINNSADEEDITTVDNLLKFKDRTTAEGMGYVILRKNKTFAEQVTKNYTIYEIRYDYDLLGDSINLPSGCVLKFNGGSLINGSIINCSSIESKHKAFDHCYIKGYSGVFKYKWISDSNVITSDDFKYLPDTIIDFEGREYTSEEDLDLGHLNNFELHNLHLSTSKGIKGYASNIYASGTCSWLDTSSSGIITDDELDSSMVGKIIRIKTADATLNDSREKNGIPTLYKGVTSIILSIDGNNVIIADRIDSFNASREYNGTTINSTYSIEEPKHYSIENCNFLFTDVSAGISLSGYEFTIENCKFIANNGANAILSLSGHTGIVRNCEVSGAYYDGTDTSYGIQCNRATNITIQNCLFFNNRRGIDFSGDYESRYNKAINNVAYSKSNDNKDISAFGGHSTSYGNVFRDNTISGMYQVGIMCRGENEIVDGNIFECSCVAFISLGVNTTVINNRSICNKYHYNTGKFLFSSCDIQSDVLVRNNIITVRETIIYSSVSNIYMENNCISLISNSTSAIVYGIKGGSRLMCFTGNRIITTNTIELFDNNMRINLGESIISGVTIPLKACTYDSSDYSSESLIINNAYIYLDMRSSFDSKQNCVGNISVYLNFSITETLPINLAFKFSYSGMRPTLSGSYSKSLISYIEPFLKRITLEDGTASDIRIAQAGEASTPLALYIGEGSYSGYLKAGTYELKFSF